MLRIDALGKAALATWSALHNNTVAKRALPVSDAAANVCVRSPVKRPHYS